MGTAVRSVYIVCKGKDQLVVAVVILKRHFGDGVVKLPLQIYYVRVQHLKLRFWWMWSTKLRMPPS